MRVAPSLIGVGLVALTAAPGLAQRTIYYSVPAPVHSATPRPLTLHDFAQALSGGTLNRTPSAGSRGPAIDTVVVVRPTCPMPVLRPDSALLERMPVTVADANGVRSMPVARSNCENPLRR